jgi:ankyrin repeat protein
MVLNCLRVPILQSLALVLTITAVGMLTALPASGHETDQYTLPLGREFQDLGPFASRYFYRAINRGVIAQNGRIRQAIDNHMPASEIESLQSADAIVAAVNGEFPYAVNIIEDFDHKVQESAMRERWPGHLPGYMPPASMTKYLMYPFNPMRAWDCATVKCYGVYLGADKIGHFTDMGMHYYNAWRGARKRGASEEDALAAAVAVGTDDPLMSEKTVLGWWTAADYSNADLVSNYTGFLFYRNLTEPIMLKGQMRPPMLVRDGACWKIAPHVRMDSDFFAWFISEHLDEAMNPGFFLEFMRDGMRGLATEWSVNVLEHRVDPNGVRRSPSWFLAKARELRAYYGANYGHLGGDEDLVLISKACFPNPKNDADRDVRGRMAIHRAVDAGDADALKQLLDGGANVNERIVSNEPQNSDWGCTPLHLAARDGRVDLVQLLIERGADVNARNHRGATPLHYAASSRPVSVFLLENKARADVADESGRTPLHWAARLGETPVVVLLMDRGFAPNARDLHGRAPLHDAATAGMAETASALIRRGAEVAAADEFHSTPLHEAASAKSADVVAVLLGARAPADARDDFGRTPLHEAARQRSQPVVAALLDAGAKPGIADAYGGTPLHIAARLGEQPVVALLVSRGADVYARSNTTHRTPIDEARNAGHAELAKLMQSGSGSLSDQGIGGATPASAVMDPQTKDPQTRNPQMKSSNVARTLNR